MNTYAARLAARGAGISQDSGLPVNPLRAPVFPLSTPLIPGPVIAPPVGETPDQRMTASTSSSPGLDSPQAGSIPPGPVMAPPAVRRSAVRSQPASVTSPTGDVSHKVELSPEGAELPSKRKKHFAGQPMEAPSVSETVAMGRTVVRIEPDAREAKAPGGPQLEPGFPEPSMAFEAGRLPDLPRLQRVITSARRPEVRVTIGQVDVRVETVKQPAPSPKATKNRPDPFASLTFARRGWRKDF